MLYFLSTNRYPLRHVLSGELRNEGEFLHSSRQLDVFVLLVGLEGTLHIAQDGHNYTLRPNEFMLLLADHPHWGYCRSEGALAYYWCHFMVDADWRLMGEEEVASFCRKELDSGITLRNAYLLPEHGGIKDLDRIVLAFRQTIDFSRKKLYTSSIVDYSLSTLAMELTQEFLQSAGHSDEQSRSFYRLVDLQEYVRLHYNENLTIPMLANMFGYNANYLSTVFRKATGVSLIRYINETRCDAAKLALLTSLDSVGAIADQVGYNDSKYFIRVFGQINGITPTKFRNTYFRKHINRE